MSYTLKQYWGRNFCPYIHVCEAKKKNEESELYFQLKGLEKGQKQSPEEFKIEQITKITVNLWHRKNAGHWIHLNIVHWKD